LLVLVLVPLTALGLQTARTATARSHTAAQAARVQLRAQALSKVIRLGFAMLDERAPMLVELQARRIQIPAETAAAVLGFGLSSWRSDTRARTDAALAGLPAWAGPAGMAELVARVRQPDDTVRGPTDASAALLLTGQQAVEARAREISTDLANQIGGAQGSSSVLRDLVALQLVYQAALLQADLAERLFDISIAQGDAATVRAELARDAARYEAVTGEINSMGSQAVRKTWQDILGSPAAVRFNQVIATAELFGRAPDVGVKSKSAEIYRQVLERRKLHVQLVGQASGVVDADVRRMRSVADSAYRAALIEGLVVGLLALLGAWFLSRGVTRPLHDIAARARRIRDGDLSVDASAGRGPREVVAVAQAFNDVAANLRLLEEQATALADGDTEHESLQRRVPGQLGRSLQISVARLSVSLTAREQLESRLRHEATHDRLTGLLNRPSAIVALEQGVARAHRLGSGLAVLVVDLDGLKRVNEAIGHATGDEVLRQVAARLARTVRGGDIVARLGADEFAIVAEVTGIGEAMELGQRLVQDLASVPVASIGPILAPRNPNAPSSVSASVGIALTLDGRATPTSLLRDADAAVHRAKETGGARIEVFDEELSSQLAERAAVEAALSAAMGRGDLRLHYQPIVEPTGRMAGMEALCRWTDPLLGEVPPSTFVAIAEATDLVVELDRWVLQEATRQLAVWREADLMADIYLSVNLSGRHLLGPSVVSDVRHALAESGVDPHQLVLEITETVLLDDLLVAAQHLTELRELGVRVAVDDFGTGYTSIAHLQRLPVDIVKVDRSFIADLTTDRGRSLVRLMVGMAATLGLGLVAEGVETAYELQQLKKMSCPLIQGYLTGRPMAPEQLLRWADAVPIDHSALTPTPPT
jgi:diguanylate cyclase (GGDEF)-like protein